MNIATFESFITFSVKGDNFLIKEKKFGPEGGGSTAFIIINAKKKEYTRFLISNNFGTGNGRIPQKVPQNTCRTVLKTLHTSLVEYGFTGIEINPETCSTAERKKCLSLSQDTLDINKKAFFSRNNTELILPPFCIRIKQKGLEKTQKNSLSLYKNNAELLKWIPDIPPDTNQMQAWLSPDNCLIILFSFVHYDHRITDILFSHIDNQYKRFIYQDFDEVKDTI